MTGTCICGAVSVTVDSKPEFIHDCNCGLCRKVGAAWGYYRSASVAVTGGTQTFERQDKETPVVQVHSCRICAATTHFELASSFRERHPSVDQVGINMRLFDANELAGVEVRFPNGKDWSGEGDYGYRRTAMTITKRDPW